MFLDFIPHFLPFLKFFFDHFSIKKFFLGTYLAIDICRDWLESSSEIQLRDTVGRIRTQRAFSVQTPEQYQFCLAALREVLKHKDSTESDS